METHAPASKGLALSSLLFGVVSLALLLVFLFSTPGNGVLIAAVALGIVGLVLGIAALRKRQSKVLSVTGLVLGALSVLCALALVVFALIFVGALTSNPM